MKRGSLVPFWLRCFVFGALILGVRAWSLQAQQDVAPGDASAATQESEEAQEEAQAPPNGEEQTDEKPAADEGEPSVEDDMPADAEQAVTKTSDQPPAQGGPDPLAAATSSATDRPAAEAFEAIFGEWKALLKEIRDTISEYKIAEESQLPQLRERFNERVAAGREMEPRLREAAVSAYREAPNEDRELLRFLITVAADYIRADDYFPARELTAVLIEGGSDEKELSDLAGLAAFGTNNFEDAEKYLQQAEADGSISSQGSNYLGSIDECLATWKKETTLRAAEAEADDLPRARLQTDAGDIVLELFENEAPETVGNFISLVEKGFYDQLTFHRVLEAFMAQAGCPQGDGSGGPGYNIYCECANDNHRSHFAGSLSMAKQPWRNTGGSQFFLTFVATPHLNGQHTIFGRVIEGWDVLPKIIKRDPSGSPPFPEPTKILKAEVLRKRDHEYRANKVK